MAKVRPTALCVLQKRSFDQSLRSRTVWFSEPPGGSADVKAETTADVSAQLLPAETLLSDTFRLACDEEPEACFLRFVRFQDEERFNWPFTVLVPPTFSSS